MTRHPFRYARTLGCLIAGALLVDAHAAPTLGTSTGAIAPESPLPVWLRSAPASGAPIPLQPDGSEHRRERQTLSDRLEDLVFVETLESIQFASAFAVDGDALAVAGDWDGGGGGAPLSGSVYLYRRDGGTWVPAQRLRDGTGDDRFGSPLALNGDTLLVGAVGYDFADVPGKVRVYKKSADGWTLANAFGAENPVPQDVFGVSLTFDGTRLAIGAVEYVDGVPSNVLYVGSLDEDGQWTQTARLKGDVPNEITGFGAGGVALQGDRLVVGAPGETVDGVARQGAVYVFAAAEGGWTRTQKLSIGAGTQSAAFGWSVALDGDALLVGADGESSHGAAYAFAFEGGAWNLRQTFRPDTDEYEAYFGHSVALRGTEAAVGCPLAVHGEQLAAGAVYTYRVQDGQWQRTDKLRRIERDVFDLGPQFGNTLAWDGDALLVGARWHQVGRSTSGSLGVFDFRPSAMAAPAAIELPASVDATASAALALGNGGGAQLRFERTDGTELRQMDLAQITPGAGVSCRDDAGSRANSWYRRFSFGDHPQVGASARVRAVTVATESGPPTDGVVRLYTMPHAAIPGTIDRTLLTPIGSGNATVGGVMTTTTIAVDGTVGDTASQDLVVEFHIDGSSPTPYFPGADPSPENRATFMLASDCGVESAGNPTAYFHQGSHLMMSVRLDAASVADYCADPAAMPWLDVSPADGWIEAGATRELTIAVDTDGLAPGRYPAPLCFVTDDPARRLLQVPLTIEVVDRVFADGFDAVSP